MRNHILPWVCILVWAAISVGHAQETAFTYQGRLSDNGNPANGTYDLVFTLYDASSGDEVVAGPVTNNNVVVDNGFFTVSLDFGGSAFNGNPRWLEIGVATNESDEFTVLSPRQKLMPAPYAIFANSARNITGPVNASTLGGLPATNYQTRLGFTPLTPQQATNVAMAVGQLATNNFLGTATNIAVAAARSLVNTNNSNTPLGGTFIQNGISQISNLFIPYNGKLWFNCDGWSDAWSSQYPDRMPHINGNDAGLVLGSYIAINGDENGATFAHIIGGPAMMDIGCDVPCGIEIAYRHPYSPMVLWRAGTAYNGHYTNTASLPYSKSYPNKILFGGGIQLFHLWFEEDSPSGPMLPNYLNLGMCNPTVTNLVTVWGTNNLMGFFTSDTNFIPNESIIQWTLSPTLPSNQVASVSLMTNLMVLTNGSVVLNGPLVLNPSPAPVVTGNQIGFWNSNGVAYQVTAISTNSFGNE